MVTQTTNETYTGVRGIVQYDGVGFAYVNFELEITRDPIKVPRGGKYSDLSLPGKVSAKGKLKYGLVEPDLFIDAFDDGTNVVTASLTTVHASIAGNGALQAITSSLTNPSTPQTLQVTTATSDTLTADYITVIGTDANDEQISEVIHYTSTAGTFYGHNVFKTVTAIITPASANSNDTFLVKAVGQRTITLGDPRKVTIMGKCQTKDGTSSIQITCTNCWLSNLPHMLSNAGEAMLPEQSFEIEDPDVDITIVATP